MELLRIMANDDCAFNPSYLLILQRYFESGGLGGDFYWLNLNIDQFGVGL